MFDGIRMEHCIFIQIDNFRIKTNNASAAFFQNTTEFRKAFFNIGIEQSVDRKNDVI